MRRWITRAIILGLVVSAFLGGLIALGQWALEQIRQHDRYLLAFDDLDCEPPPGLDRVAFLDEVRYLARLPARLSLLDEGLGTLLAKGFERHPWVAAVTDIKVEPPRRVSVRLRYRQPVLAIRLGDVLRVVDGEGILLPPGADTRGLPLYQGKAQPPAGPAGSPWGDPAVEARARSLDR